MADTIITGASRGIGAALATALSEAGHAGRLILLARDVGRLDTLAAGLSAGGARVVTLGADLSSLASARRAAAALVEIVESDAVGGDEAAGATLVHNAGLWPARRVITSEGYEASFVVNALAPVVLERALLRRGLLARSMGVSAGLIVKGSFDRERTPFGADFGAVHTYCATKLAGAVALRALGDGDARLVDHVVLHPGVVQTDLGARPGILGALLRLVKRSWETPEACAARLARILARPRWQTAMVPWLVEDEERPWPKVCDVVRAEVEEAVGKALEDG